MSNIYDRLVCRLGKPLPGADAQYLMAPPMRLHDQVPPHARKAAVVLLLVEVGDDMHIVLIERAMHAKDKHSGQISFPGGSYDEEDGSLFQTALREVEEEIGVPRHLVMILGALTELYIPVSNFLVQPFVGVLCLDVPLRPQPGEVKQILMPMADFFLEDTSRLKKDIVLDNGITLNGVPAYEYNGKVIWGATAMIMSEFCELVKTMTL